MIEKELKTRIDLTLRKIGVRNYNYTNDYSQKGLYMFMTSPFLENPLIKQIANTQKSSKVNNNNNNNKVPFILVLNCEYTADELMFRLDSYIDDNGAYMMIQNFENKTLTVDHIEKMVQTLNSAERDVIMISIDNIKRLKSSIPFEDIYMETGNVVRDLKLLSKKYNIPIITTHQLDRQCVKLLNESDEKAPCVLI